MKVDHETLPKCRLEEKKFSWGEPYLEVIPIFDTLISQELSNILCYCDTYNKRCKHLN